MLEATLASLPGRLSIFSPSCIAHTLLPFISDAPVKHPEQQFYNLKVNGVLMKDATVIWNSEKGSNEHRWIELSCKVGVCNSQCPPLGQQTTTTDYIETIFFLCVLLLMATVWIIFIGFKLCLRRLNKNPIVIAGHRAEFNDAYTSVIQHCCEGDPMEAELMELEVILSFNETN